MGLAAGFVIMLVFGYVVLYVGVFLIGASLGVLALIGESAGKSRYPQVAATPPTIVLTVVALLAVAAAAVHDMSPYANDLVMIVISVTAVAVLCATRTLLPKQAALAVFAVAFIAKIYGTFFVGYPHFYSYDPVFPLNLFGRGQGVQWVQFFISELIVGSAVDYVWIFASAIITGKIIARSASTP